MPIVSREGHLGVEGQGVAPDGGRKRTKERGRGGALVGGVAYQVAEHFVLRLDAVEDRLLQVLGGTGHLADAGLDGPREGLGGEGHRGAEVEDGEEVVHIRNLSHTSTS